MEPWVPPNVAFGIGAAGFVLAAIGAYLTWRGLYRVKPGVRRPTWQATWGAYMVGFGLAIAIAAVLLQVQGIMAR